MDTHLKYIKLSWNNNGSILAASGVQYAKSSQGEEKEVCVIQFYDSFGQVSVAIYISIYNSFIKYLRSLKVPGKRVNSISWEHNGLRIALAVDSFIYFANIRPDYKWTFFADDILAYSFTKTDRSETAVVFWNTKSNEKYIKYGYSNFCVLIQN